MPLWRAGGWWGPTGVVVLWIVGVCGAQEGKVVPSTPGNPYTLHVYENQVQVPTLVLDRRRATETGLRAEDFTVRLDEGPKFRPLAARVEGDDPLALAIVIDATSAVTPEMLANFRLELASLPDGLLTERDRVSVYAADCALVRAPRLNIPATKEGLDEALKAVLESTTLHGESASGVGCDGSRRIWDEVAVAATGIGSLPGRRVMIVVSDGVDHGSVNRWNRVTEYADGLDVTVIGLRSGGPPLVSQAFRGTGSGVRWNQRPEDPFSLLCAGTGGITLEADVNTVAAALEKAIRLVRERYVLEFLRPKNPVGGIHQLDVRVPDRKAIVRPGGVLVEMEDPKLVQDPSVVPSDQSRAPVFGTRRALSKPQ